MNQLTNHVNNQSFIQSPDVIQVNLTLKMTTVQVRCGIASHCQSTVDNSPSQDYAHSDDHAQPTYEMTPRLKPFTKNSLIVTVVFIASNFGKNEMKSD